MHAEHISMLLLAGHRHTYHVVIGQLSMRVMAIIDKRAVLRAIYSIFIIEKALKVGIYKSPHITGSAYLHVATSGPR